METNTVLLDLREYNKLRDFYNGIKDGKFVCANLYEDDIYYIKEVKILERCKNRVSFFKNKSNKLISEIISLKKELETKEELPKKGWLKRFLKL